MTSANLAKVLAPSLMPRIVKVGSNALFCQTIPQSVTIQFDDCSARIRLETIVFFSTQVETDPELAKKFSDLSTIVVQVFKDFFSFLFLILFLLFKSFFIFNVSCFFFLVFFCVGFNISEFCA